MGGCNTECRLWGWAWPWRGCPESQSYPDKSDHDEGPSRDWMPCGDFPISTRPPEGGCIDEATHGGYYKMDFKRTIATTCCVKGFRAFRCESSVANQGDFRQRAWVDCGIA